MLMISRVLSSECWLPVPREPFSVPTYWCGPWQVTLADKVTARHPVPCQRRLTKSTTRLEI